MSQENVEIVRGVWEAFVSLSFPPDAFAPDATWHTRTDIPDTEVCQGPEAIARMLAEGWATVTEPSIKVEQILPAGDRVIIEWTATGTGRESRIPIEWTEAHIYALWDGKITEVREFRTLAEALEAVRLSE